MFEAELERDRARLVRLCAYLSGDRDLAEDLAQETLLVAWRNMHKLYTPELRSRWLSGIARNVCLSWMQRHRRELRRLASPDEGAPPPLEELADDFDVEVELERHELVELLDRALALLPAETRTVLIERYVAEAPHAEIAARLGVSDKAVSMRLSRGKLLLKQLLTTELRDEAVGCGLIPAEMGDWQSTRVWCLKCGQHRLLAHVPRPPGAISFRCPYCDPTPEMISSSFRLANAHFARLLGGLTRPRSILNRTADWAHGYFLRVFNENAAICTNCGRPAHVRRAWQTETSALDGHHILYVECETCGEVVSQSFGGLVSAFPQVQSFWRKHARLRTIPAHEIEVGGQTALVTRFESVADTARLDIVIARDTLKLLGVHGTPDSERSRHDPPDQHGA